MGSGGSRGSRPDARLDGRWPLSWVFWVWWVVVGPGLASSGRSDGSGASFAQLGLPRPDESGCAEGALDQH